MFNGNLKSVQGGVKVSCYKHVIDSSTKLLTLPDIWFIF